MSIGMLKIASQSKSSDRYEKLNKQLISARSGKTHAERKLRAAEARIALLESLLNKESAVTVLVKLKLTGILDLTNTEIARICKTSGTEVSRETKKQINS